MLDPTDLRKVVDTAKRELEKAMLLSGRLGSHPLPAKVGPGHRQGTARLLSRNDSRHRRPGVQPLYQRTSFRGSWSTAYSERSAPWRTKLPGSVTSSSRTAKATTGGNAAGPRPEARPGGWRSRLTSPPPRATTTQASTSRRLTRLARLGLGCRGTLPFDLPTHFGLRVVMATTIRHWKISCLRINGKN